MKFCLREMGAIAPGFRADLLIIGFFGVPLETR
jgi:adenine deaminase